MKEEWPLALTNVAALSLCNAAAVWSLAPSRSYGSTASSGWQMALQKLPHNVFDRSYRLREFTMPDRVASFYFQAAKLTAGGAATGALAGAVSNAILAHKRKR